MLEPGYLGVEEYWNLDMARIDDPAIDLRSSTVSRRHAARFGRALKLVRPALSSWIASEIVR